jgi:signal transduction histidine kinase
VTELVDRVREGFAQKADHQAVALECRSQPEIWTDADPVLLRQAVSNLIDNALAHAPAGGMVAVDVTKLGAGYEIAVSDSGPGFDPELLPKAFEPFTHGDGAAGRRMGAGLGLAIVRAIAEAHGGAVTASNSAEGGARVVLTLPS